MFNRRRGVTIYLAPSRSNDIFSAVKDRLRTVAEFIAAIRASRKDKLGVLADAGPGGMEKHPLSLDAVAFSRRATRFVRSLLSMTYSRREGTDGA